MKIILIIVIFTIGYLIGVKHKRFITSVQYHSPSHYIRITEEAKNELIGSYTGSDYDRGVLEMARKVQEKL